MLLLGGSSLKILTIPGYSSVGQFEGNFEECGESVGYSRLWFLARIIKVVKKGDCSSEDTITSYAVYPQKGAFRTFGIRNLEEG